ncbi:MAG: hypothetical protein ACXVXL_30885 [Solirubrobacteraceae bacterium]
MPIGLIARTRVGTCAGPRHDPAIGVAMASIPLPVGVADHAEEVLARGRRDRTIRRDVTAHDIIITGAMLARPLPHADDWDQIARRQARIYVAGLAAPRQPLQLISSPV